MRGKSDTERMHGIGQQSLGKTPINDRPRLRATVQRDQHLSELRASFNTERQAPHLLPSHDLRR